MVKCSNGLVGTINFISLIASIPIIGAGLWFRLVPSTECSRILQWPFIILGLSLMILSLLGIFGSCCRLNFFLWIYLFFMFLLVIGLFCFTVFVLVVTNKGVGQAVKGKGYMEYRLDDYSTWLQKRVDDYETWLKLEGCLKEANICGDMKGEIFDKAEEFYKTALSPTQSGCCKPPSFCGYTYQNATYWTVPKSGLTSTDSDCTTWSNDQMKLCFGCKSCKAGMLANIKSNWKILAIFNACFLVFLIIVYSVGCCAFRNNRVDHRYHRYH